MYLRMSRARLIWKVRLSLCGYRISWKKSPPHCSATYAALFVLSLLAINSLKIEFLYHPF